MQIALSGFQQRRRIFEEAGIAFELNWVLDNLVLGKSTEPILKECHRPGTESPTEEDNEAIDENLFDEDCDKYRKYLERLCPKDWKDQDHYKVLGLSKLRYKATAGHIKTAYRQKVLRYHPDKGKYKEQLGAKGNDMFGCIQKAYELMCEQDKRRSFDSIDKTFDESIPEASAVNQKNFFTVLGPVFERNSRFSKIQPVPQLEDMNASRHHVEDFYEFWFSFPSWREFSYLDAEDKSKGEDRYERREIEKQNRSEREKLRKADLKRISTLVQLTYDKDPRIAIFKRQEKEFKESEKNRKILEKQRILDEKKAKEAEEERSRQEQIDKEKEEQKKAKLIRQEEKKITAAKRKKLREVSSAANHWTEDPGQKLPVMEHVERICMFATDAQLDEVAVKLEKITIYDEVLQVLENTAKKENVQPLNAPKKVVEKQKESSWTEEEVALLIKAANMFPAGTSRRWFQVATYINDHNRERMPKTEKEVIKEAKSRAAQVTAPGNVAQVQESKQPEPTPQPAAAGTPGSTTDDWTEDEQKKFERALKEIPAADAKRWEKIGEATGKTKKECVQRYKKIVEMLKAKKASG